MNEVTKLAPAQDFGGALMEILRNKDIAADKLQIVMQMQRELIAERRRESFMTAFVPMSSEIPQVEKLGVVDLGHGKGSYPYALWEDMDTVLRPILSRYGFALTFREVINGAHPKLIGELMHADGHSLIAERVLIADAGPGRNAQQAHGSAVAYAKRHLAMELCNVVTKGQDDDGRGLRELFSKEQILDIENLLEANAMPLSEFIEWVGIPGVEKLEDIPGDHYPRLKNALEGRKKRLSDESNDRGGSS